MNTRDADVHDMLYFRAGYNEPPATTQRSLVGPTGVRVQSSNSIEPAEGHAGVERRYRTVGSMGAEESPNRVVTTSTPVYERRIRFGKTLRRLNGFVVHLGKHFTRVALVEDGQNFFYEWPSEELRAKDIKVEHQPFQVDEIQIDVPGRGSGIIYEFRPLATVGDARIEPLPLDAEYRAKRDKLLAVKKAQT